MVLTDIEIKLAEQLLTSLSKRESVVEYNELGNRVNPPVFWRQVGKHVGQISKLCNELGLPLISAMVVGKTRGTAGQGFYPLYKELKNDTEGMTEIQLFRREIKRIHECKEWYRLADYLNLNIDLQRPIPDHPLNDESIDSPDSSAMNAAQYLPEEIIENHLTHYPEGLKKTVIVNAYERNHTARQECIRIHGNSCVICGFNFKQFYGSVFEGKIHVHHIVPLNEIDDLYHVNPQTDLIPVCPNCHLAIHSKPNGVYSTEEIKSIINKHRNLNN